MDENYEIDGNGLTDNKCMSNEDWTIDGTCQLDENLV